VRFVLVIVGALIGTVSLCDVIPNIWGAVGWMISIISTVQILSVGRRTTAGDYRPPSVVCRVAVAAVAVFSLIFVTAMLTAFNANPQGPGRADVIAASCLVLLGVISIALSLRMSR